MPLHQAHFLRSPTAYFRPLLCSDYSSGSALITALYPNFLYNCLTWLFCFQGACNLTAHLFFDRFFLTLNKKRNGRTFLTYQGNILVFPYTWALFLDYYNILWYYHLVIVFCAAPIKAFQNISESHMLLSL